MQISRDPLVRTPAKYLLVAVRINTNYDYPSAATEGDKPKAFTYDFSFWSHNPSDDKFAGQDDVYKCLGPDILDSTLEVRPPPPSSS